MTLFIFFNVFIDFYLQSRISISDEKLIIAVMAYGEQYAINI